MVFGGTVSGSRLDGEVKERPPNSSRLSRRAPNAATGLPLVGGLMYYDAVWRRGSFQPGLTKWQV